MRDIRLLHDIFRNPIASRVLSQFYKAAILSRHVYTSIIGSDDDCAGVTAGGVEVCGVGEEVYGCDGG